MLSAVQRRNEKGEERGTKVERNMEQGNGEGFGAEEHTFTFFSNGKTFVSTRVVTQSYLDLLFRLSSRSRTGFSYEQTMRQIMAHVLTGSSVSWTSTPSSNFRFSPPVSPSPFVDSGAEDAVLNRSSRALRLRSSSICSAVFSTGLSKVRAWPIDQLGKDRKRSD